MLLGGGRLVRIGEGGGLKREGEEEVWERGGAHRVREARSDRRRVVGCILVGDGGIMWLFFVFV